LQHYRASAWPSAAGLLRASDLDLAFHPQRVLPQQAAAIVTDQGRKVAAGGGGLGLADAGAIRSADRVSAVV
jgi:hypothetical protein